MAVTTKADRIAQRTLVATTRGNDGRVRYLGQPRKGHPARETVHAMDVRVAISELEGAHEMLVTPDLDALDPIARRENRKTAVAKIALAARALDDVLRREDEPLPDTVNRPPRRGR